MVMKKRKFLLLLVTILLLGLLAACTGQNAGENEPNANQGSAPTGDGQIDQGPTEYPMQTDVALTYWAALPNNLTGVAGSFEEVPFYQEWQKRTGVDIEFMSPATNQEKEALNVLLASGSLPDMISYNFISFPGGPEKAIADGYILRLNELIDQYAPNFKKYLEEHPEVDKMIKTDNGNYFAFPFIRGDESLLVFQGPMLRKDWLEELNLPVPETIDEWTETLRAFKEEKGAAAPLSLVSKPNIFRDLVNGAFVGAFGVTKGFYLDNDVVKYGPMESGYKEFLATMRSWYEEGLLDPNIATVDGKAIDANMASGATGATVGNTGGGIGKWTPLIQENDPQGSLIAAPYPVLNKGDKPKFGQRDYFFSPGGMVAITGSSEKAELAVKLLDYGYGEEGHMLHNFGIESVSYTMEGDYPTYTDLLMNNPDGLAPAQAMSMYIRGNYHGPFVQDKRYLEQYLQLPEQHEAIEVWKNTDMAEHQIPLVTPTPEESSEYAKIMTDIETLVDEMTLKIILGSEPVDSFEEYVEKMKSLKIDRAIEIQTEALKRYENR